MIDRLIPLFAIIGVVSSIGYLAVIFHILYNTWGHLVPAATKQAKHKTKKITAASINTAVKV